MVVEVLTNAGQIDEHRNIEPFQLIGRPDPRQHQHFRARKSSCRQQYLAGAPQRLLSATSQVLDPDGTLVLQQDSVDLRSRHDAQPRIRSHPAQKCLRGTATSTAASGKLQVTGTGRGTDVEVCGEWQAERLPGLDEKVAVLAEESGIRDRQRTGAAMKFAAVLLIALEPAEMRQHGCPAPQVAAGRRSPLVIVGSVAAHVDLRIDAAASSEDSPRRDLEDSIAGVRLGNGLVKCAMDPLGHQSRVAGAELEVGARVVSAGLQQNDPRIGLGHQPPCGNASCRAAPDDDVFAVPAGAEPEPRPCIHETDSLQRAAMPLPAHAGNTRSTGVMLSCDRGRRNFVVDRSQLLRGGRW